VLFAEKRSGLVRLTDTVKSNLLFCSSTTSQLIAAHERHKPIYDAIRALAKQALEGNITHEAAQSRMDVLQSTIPTDQSAVAIELVAHLHSQSLTTILLSCFTLESYINNLAYFLISEADLLGLIKLGHKTSAELVLDAIDRMSSREKWAQVSRLGNSAGLDKSRYPAQDFGYLFNFRDDLVHDKVAPYSDERAKKRYNARFPDPVFAQLSLKHASYAATVYWDMAQEMHRVLGVPASEFHRHYNLSPWRNEDERKKHGTTRAAV
jgi:hypothetical protein